MKNLLLFLLQFFSTGGSPQKLQVLTSSVPRPTLDPSTARRDLQTLNRRAAAARFLGDERLTRFKFYFHLMAKMDIPVSSLLPIPTVTFLLPQRTPKVGRETPQIPLVWTCLILSIIFIIVSSIYWIFSYCKLFCIHYLCMRWISWTSFYRKKH